MAITAIDKIKITKYLNSHSLDDIYYLDMCEAIGKKDKITDVEFLEYFTECIINELRKDSKLSIKYLSKVAFSIDSFLEWINESGSEIKEDTLDKIRSLKDFYDDYLKRTGFEKDLNFSENCIDVVLEKVNKLYPSDKKEESIVEYVNKIAQLESNVKELRRQLTDVTKVYGDLQISYTKKTGKVESLNQEIVSLNNEVQNKEKETFKLNQIIEGLNAKINELEASILQLSSENDVLVTFKDKCDVLTSEVEQLRKIVDDDIKAKNMEANSKNRHQEIEALIYQKLLVERSTVDDILSYIKEQGIISNKEEIATLLRNMRSKINIDRSSFSSTPIYKVEAPKVLKDGTFEVNIPSNSKCFDIMLVSDFHIKNFDCDVLSGFDMLNDYCVKNGISLILNLGDFYHGLGKLMYSDAIKNYNLCEHAITKIPKVDGLYHAILGGNHDQKIFQYGFDPIALLTNEREDFIDLGYTHSTVSLNSPLTELGEFDIHHPDSFNIEIDFNKGGINLEHLNSYLDNIYDAKKRNREDSYIDIFGHTHKSQYNFSESYCYIPNFFRVDTQKEACHLRIYFDDNNKIKYMLFMPLSSNKEGFLKNNEIVYQKVLKR